MDLWKVFCISLICTISHSKSEKESDTLATSKEMLKSAVLKDADEISKCICFAKSKSGNNVLNYIKADGEDLERLVVYLYRSVNERQISVYIPNQEKQVIFPDLIYDGNDLIIPNGEITVDDVFIQGFNLLTSINVSDDENTYNYSLDNDPNVPDLIDPSVNGIPKKTLDGIIITELNDQGNSASTVITNDNYRNTGNLPKPISQNSPIIYHNNLYPWRHLSMNPDNENDYQKLKDPNNWQQKRYLNKNRNPPIRLPIGEINYDFSEKNNDYLENFLYELLLNANNRNYNNKNVHHANYKLYSDSINTDIPNDADLNIVSQNLVKHQSSNNFNIPGELLPNRLKLNNNRYHNSNHKLLKFFENPNNNQELYNMRYLDLYPDSNRVLVLNINELSKMFSDLKKGIQTTPIRLPSGEMKYVILNNDNDKPDNINPFYQFLLNYNRKNNIDFNRPTNFDLNTNLKGLHLFDSSKTDNSFPNWINYNLAALNFSMPFRSSEGEVKYKHPNDEMFLWELMQQNSELNYSQNMQLSFSQWIQLQIKFIEVQAYITFTDSDMHKMSWNVKNMLERNNILLFNNQQLCSLNGETLDVSNLVMYPVFTKISEESKILEIILVKLSREPSILGIIPLGMSTMPDILSTCAEGLCKLQPTCIYNKCTPKMKLKYDVSKRIKVPIDWSFVYPVVGHIRNNIVNTRSPNNIDEKAQQSKDSFTTLQVLHNRIMDTENENNLMKLVSNNENSTNALDVKIRPEDTNNTLLNNDDTDDVRKKRHVDNLIGTYSYIRPIKDNNDALIQLDSSFLQHIIKFLNEARRKELQKRIQGIEQAPTHDLPFTVMQSNVIPARSANTEAQQKQTAGYANLFDVPVGVVKNLLNILSDPLNKMISNVKETSISGRIREPAENTEVIQGNKKSIQEQFNGQYLNSIPDNSPLIRANQFQGVNSDDKNHHDINTENDLLNETPQAYNPKVYVDDAGELHIKILGGQAATSSGTPIVSKGRSGDETD